MGKPLLRLWAVMTATRFDAVEYSIHIPGCARADVKAPTPPGDPTHFLPLFRSRADAEVWADGRFEVREIVEERAEIAAVKEDEVGG